MTTAAPEPTADLLLQFVPHAQSAGYRVKLTFTPADGGARQEFPGDGRPPAYFAPVPETLLIASSDADTYGRALGGQLFADPELLVGYRIARDASQRAGHRLRVRLQIDWDVRELHGVRWETLVVPGDEQAVAVQERVLLSRYLAAAGPIAPSVRRVADLRALVVVASPSNLGDYRLHALDIPMELDYARAALGAIACDTLGEHMPVTLDALQTHLRSGCDILYLIAHGLTSRTGDRVIVLAKPDGTADLVTASALAAATQAAAPRLRLAALAVCESAGAGESWPRDNSALAAVGPQLLLAGGLPAVVAMQALVSVDTANACLGRFFQELQRIGAVDLAMAIGRGVVRNRLDAWAPVVWMRVEHGRLWEEPAAATGAPATSTSVTGGGAVAQGGSVAAGAGGLAVGGNVYGNIIIGADGAAENERSQYRKILTEFLVPLQTYLAYTYRVFDKLRMDTGIEHLEYDLEGLKRIYGAVLSKKDPRRITWMATIEHLQEENRKIVKLIDENSGNIVLLEFREACIAFKIHANEWEIFWRELQKRELDTPHEVYDGLAATPFPASFPDALNEEYAEVTRRAYGDAGK